MAAFVVPLSAQTCMGDGCGLEPTEAIHAPSLLQQQRQHMAAHGDGDDDKAFPGCQPGETKGQFFDYDHTCTLSSTSDLAKRDDRGPFVTCKHTTKTEGVCDTWFDDKCRDLGLKWCCDEEDGQPKWNFRNNGQNNLEDVVKVIKGRGCAGCNMMYGGRFNDDGEGFKEAELGDDTFVAVSCSDRHSSKNSAKFEKIVYRRPRSSPSDGGAGTPVTRIARKNVDQDDE